MQYKVMLGDGAVAQTVYVIVSSAEHEQLEPIADDSNRPSKHVERARVVLASVYRESAQRVAGSQATQWTGRAMARPTCSSKSRGLYIIRSVTYYLYAA